MSLSQTEQKCISIFIHRPASISKSNTILPTIQMLPVTGGQPQLKHVWHNILLTRIPSSVYLPGMGEGGDKKSSAVK